MLMVPKVPMVLMVSKARLVPKVGMVPKMLLVAMVSKVSMVSTVPIVLKVLMVYMIPGDYGAQGVYDP